MKFSIDPKIFQTFPGVVIGVVVIKDMDNHSHNDEVCQLLRTEEARQKKILTGIELGTLPEITAWRDIYRKFGSNLHEYRSSIESLLRRARGGSKPLPQINKLVDIYNYFSLKYHLPIGAEDLDKVKGDISLGFSDGTEKGIALGFETEETPDVGEVIYKDDAGFICRKWNWREADRTKIEETTSRAIMVMEKVTVVSNITLFNAMNEAKDLIERYLDATCNIAILDTKKSEILI